MDVVGDRVTNVEQRARIVVADRRHDGDAGHAKKEGERQRALVERRQDYGRVDAPCAQVVDQAQRVAEVDGEGIGVDPRGPVDHDVVDAGQQGGRLCTTGAAEVGQPRS